jgi:hypothetical protein
MSKTHVNEPKPARVFNPDLTVTDYIATIELPYAVFRKFRVHPTQRDTALHAIRLHGTRHLDRPLEQHCEVSGILIGDPARNVTIASMREQFTADRDAALDAWAHKADGHCRVYLADRGLWAAPSILRTTLYAARDAKAAAQIYQAIDSIDAAKRPADQLQSTLRVAGIAPQSEFVQKCSGLQRALDLATGVFCGSLHYTAKSLSKADDQLIPEEMREFHALLPYLRAVETFKPAIEIIDDLKLSGKTIPLEAPFVGAYLSVLQRDPEEGLRFLEAVKSGSGTLQNEQMDPIFIVHSLPPYFANRKARDLKPAVRTAQKLSGVLNAYEAWLKGVNFPTGKPNYLRESVIARFNPVLRDRLERALATDAPSSASHRSRIIRPRSDDGAAVSLPTLMAPG